MLIYIDIDGVLIPYGKYGAKEIDEYDELIEQNCCQQAYRLAATWFNPACLNALEYLRKAVNGRYVVHSSWVNSVKEDTIECLIAAGIKREHFDNDWIAWWHQYPTRGKAIVNHMRDNDWPENYIIVEDDIKDLQENKIDINSILATNKDTGLTHEGVQEFLHKRRAS